MLKVKLRFLLAIFLYGTIGWFLRFVTLPTDVVVVCRAGLGTLTILLIMKLRHIRIDRQRVKVCLGALIASGVCLGLNWVFLFAAYRMTTVAMASLCNYMAPMIIIIIAPFALHERTSPKKIACVFAALIGMVFVSGVLTGGTEAVNIPGMALGLGAALGFVGLVIFNRRISGISYYERAAIQLPAACLTAAVYSLISHWGEKLTLDARSAWIVLMLGVLHTGIAYCFYYDGMARLPLATYAILGYLEPVIAVLISVILLHEPMDALGWIGTVLIIGAAVVSEMISIRETEEERVEQSS